MAVVSDASNVGMNYEEKSQSQSKNKVTVNISVFFSSYSYGFLKKHFNWDYKPAEGLSHVEIFRFINRIRWSTKITDLQNYPQKISLDEVPAMNFGSAKNDFQLQSVNKLIFVDCTKKKDGKNVVELSWESMTGYLSFAVSEVKDLLFRMRKRGDYYGDVNFVIAGYDPLEPLVQAFCSVVTNQVIKNTGADYVPFTQTVKQEPWFANVSKWFEKYDWTPHLEECAMFQGMFYGANRESVSSKAMKIKKMFDEQWRLMRPYWVYHPQFGWITTWSDDTWMVEWKEKGYASTDRGAKRENRPIYRFNVAVPKEYGPNTYKNERVIGTGFTNAFLHTPGDEEPLAYINGDYYTFAETQAVMNECDKMMTGDRMGPKAWIGPAPRRGQALKTEQMLNMQADAMQEDLDEWVTKVHDPQIKEYEQQIEYIDQRHSDNGKYDPIEEEIWERKNVEDEAVSDRWSAGIDDIEYQGKTVDRAYFEKEIEALKKERKERERQIQKLRDNAALIQWLKIVGCIQLFCGFISLGATASAAVTTLFWIDVACTVAKMAFKVAYKENYTLGDAISDHFIDFLNIGISMGMMHTPFKNATDKEMKTINSLKPTKAPQKNLDSSYNSATMPTEFSSSSTAMPKEFSSTQVSTGEVSSMTQAHTGMPKEMTSYHYPPSNQATVSNTPMPTEMPSMSTAVMFYPREHLLQKMLSMSSDVFKTMKELGKHSLHILNKELPPDRVFNTGRWIYSVHSEYDSAVTLVNRKAIDPAIARKSGIEKIDDVEVEKVFTNEKEEGVIFEIKMESAPSFKTEIIL